MLEWKVTRNMIAVWKVGRNNKWRSFMDAHCWGRKRADMTCKPLQIKRTVPFHTRHNEFYRWHKPLTHRICDLVVKSVTQITIGTDNKTDKCTARLRIFVSFKTNLMWCDLKNRPYFQYNIQTPEQWSRYKNASVSLRLIAAAQRYKILVEAVLFFSVCLCSSSASTRVLCY